MIVAEYLQGLWRNIGINKISVAIIREQIRQDINFFVSVKKVQPNFFFLFNRFKVES
jgi:hypothetical protein